MSIVFSVSKENHSKTEILEIIRKSFVEDLVQWDLTKTSSEYVKGTFNIAHRYINKYIFSDLIMNDPYFSKLVYVNDSKTATSKRNEMRVYIGETSANVIPSINNIESRMGELGKRYTKVNVVKTLNKHTTKIFTDTLLKLLIRYEEKFNETVAIYNHFIPNFVADPGIETNMRHSRMTLKDVMPEFFDPRPYDKTRKPLVVSSEEAKNKDLFLDYLIFPREDPEDENAPRYYFACEKNITTASGEVKKNAYAYVGLKVNEYSSNKKHPFRPVCNMSSQRDSKNYKDYYSKNVKETDIISAVGDKNKLVTTNKYIRVGGHGTVPKPLIKILNTASFQEYIRIGVNTSAGSLIEAVAQASLSWKEQTPIRKFYPKFDKTTTGINMFRTKLSKFKSTLSVCRQECFDMTVEEIAKEIADHTKFLSAKKYVRLVETLFNCNVVVFRVSDESFEFVTPSFSQTGMVKWAPAKRNCVVLLEQYGTEADNLKYPMYEIISKSNKSSFFTHDESKKMREMLYKVEFCQFGWGLRSRSVVPLFPPSPPSPPSPSTSIKVLSQILDPNGKARILNCKMTNSLREEVPMSFYTDPLPPRSVSEVFTEYNIVDLKGVSDREFQIFLSDFNRHGIVFSSKSTLDGIVRELHGEYEGVSFTVPVEINASTIPSSLSEVPFKFDLQFSGNTNSQSNFDNLEEYRKMKKRARIVIETFHWFFSKFMKENDIVSPTNDDVFRFVRERVQLIEGFSLDTASSMSVSKYLLQSPYIRDGKFIVSSRKMLDRLLYTLNITISRELRKILEFHVKTSLDSYYEDISDFDDRDGTVIFYNLISLKRWLSPVSNVLHKMPNESLNEPYFSNLGTNETFLCINSRRYNDALAVSDSWSELGYIDRHYKSNVPTSKVMFVTKEGFEPRFGQVLGEPTTKDLTVAVWKNGGKDFYSPVIRKDE